MTSLYLPGVAIILTSILLIIYFLKRRVTLFENKFYVIMMFAILVDSICVFSLFYEFYHSTEHNFLFVKIMNKIDYISLVAWSSSLFCYILTVTVGEEKLLTGKRPLIKYIVGLNIFMVFLILSTNMDVIIDDTTNLATVGGTSVGVALISCLIYFLSAFILTLTKVRNLNKKYTPMLVFIIVAIFLGFNFVINPFFIDISFGLSLVNLIMYFTIEDPDIKMIEELNKNKLLVEKSHESKSNLVYKLIQDVKPRILQIDLLSKNKTNPEENMFRISEKSTEVLNIINEVLNITDIDESKIKIYKTSYDVKNLLNEINLIIKKELIDDIDYYYNFNKNLPNKLYGDKIVLKQVICAIFYNILKENKSGKLGFTIDPFIKDETCKLIINISSSSYKMSLEDINKILNIQDDFYYENINSIKGFDIDFLVIHKMIKILGGSFNIKKNDEETNFIITLTQKIYSQNEMKNTKNYGLSRVLLVSERTNILDQTYNLLSKYNVEIRTSINGNDSLNLINSEYFDFVFIDSMLEKPSVITLVNKIHEDNISKAKLIVLVDKIQEKVKNNYLENYNFDYAILYEDLEHELVDFSKKFK